MVRISPWVWVGLAVIGVLAVVVQQSSEASYWRGMADDAESRLKTQQLVLDSAGVHADSLADALAAADSAALAHRLQAEREVARLTRGREEARQRSEALVEGLKATLDSAQAAELDAVVASHEAELVVLEEVIAVERGLTVAERLRATHANELVLGLRSVIAEHEASAVIMASQIAAMRSAMRPSLGLRLKADWWMAVVGFVAGALVTK